MVKRLFALFAAAGLAFFAISCEKNGSDEKDDPVVIDEVSLAGTWEGGVEADFAQGYPQKWRIRFEGKNYITWHTHQTAGSINDDVQGLKTVGNKEQGTWEYADGVLTLTPSRMWASYVITSLSSSKYTYYNYDPDTMECDNWYETPESLIADGIARDIRDGSDWYISKWKSVVLTEKTLSVKINMDTFTLEKK